MKVNEIFHSIDGEGITAGQLATFIRLSGCNMRCRYCDTEYALDTRSGEELTIEEILNKCKYRNVTLTGGEPLIHTSTRWLVEALAKSNHIINIETNGSVNIAPYISLDDVIITMDYKTVSSGENKKMSFKNINLLRESDVLKIVMNRSDFADVKKMLRETAPKCYIYLSPIFNEIDPVELVGFLKECHEDGINTDKMRVQLQLHKYIWEPMQKGV